MSATLAGTGRVSEASARIAAPDNTISCAIATSIASATARVAIPALVRGDELITKNGCYGDLLRECRRLEAEGTALAAGIMIGNPFTDVPELCSQVLVMTDNDAATAEREATRLAQEFWPLRFRMQGKLIALDVKAGDKVLFSKYSGTEVKIDGEEHLIMREDDILGVIEG